jgi:hypothetical protein
MQLSTETKQKIYHIRNSEKCFRFKPEAFEAHAPPHRGIYELVTFDESQNPQVLFVGAAFESTIFESLQGHLDGTVKPSAGELLIKYPNLYFDYIAEMDAKTKEDAQDIYWWLLQKHKPACNDWASVQPSKRFETIHVVELE